MLQIRQFTLDNTDKEILAKWYSLLTLGRQLDKKAPNYLKQALVGRIMHLTPAMMVFNFLSDRSSTVKRTFFFSITVNAYGYFSGTDSRRNYSEWYF